jgi:RNA polymerase sigma-70 factor (TIGR02943 family)
MGQELIDSDQWVDRYGDAMFRFTLLRVKDEDHAEEIVQNAFLAALKAKESFAGRSSEKTWLFGILKFKILDHYREIRKNQTCDLSVDDDHDPCDSDFNGKGHWLALPFNWGIDPEKSVENKQLLQTLSGCMDKLSDKFRRLFVLREIERMDSEKICSELGISSNNFFVMLHRARNQLKKCLEEHLIERNPNA